MKKLILALTTATLIACAPAHAQQIEDWHYSERVDAMTDEDRSGAITLSDNGGSFGITCMPGGPMIIASPGQYLTSNERLETTWRIGDGEPVTKKLPAVEPLVVMPYEISEQLEAADVIIIRFSDYRGRQYTHSFSLIGYYDATGLLSCVE